MSETENEFPDLAPIEQDAPAAVAQPQADNAPTDGSEQGSGEPEPRRLAGKFDSPEALEEAYRNLESEVGRFRNEVGQERSQREQYERELQMYQQAYQPPPGGAQQAKAGDEGPPQLSRDEWEEWNAEDPFSATQYLAAMTAAPLLAERERMLEPVFGAVNETQAERTVNGLKAEFGDEVVHRNQQALAGAIERDMGYFEDPTTRHERLRRVIESEEYRRLREGTQPRGANGQQAAGAEPVHVEGGSTPAPQQARQDVDPEIAAIDAAGTRRDIFGALPPH